ncbi:hypothetical protein BGY98DRAFT_965992 [Russula aff. rugulosa BPL654]|nr:hypothetical protein BGY98DRAFT_965992 [Russula aff. rugulosa BPL654]
MPGSTQPLLMVVFVWGETRHVYSCNGKAQCYCAERYRYLGEGSVVTPEYAPAPPGHAHECGVVASMTTLTTHLAPLNYLAGHPTSVTTNRTRERWRAVHVVGAQTAP